MILVSKYTFSGPSIIFISMVAFFQNGRQNIPVLITPLLINIEKNLGVKYTFSGPRQDYGE